MNNIVFHWIDDAGSIPANNFERGSKIAARYTGLKASIDQPDFLKITQAAFAAKLFFTPSGDGHHATHGNALEDLAEINARWLLLRLVEADNKFSRLEEGMKSLFLDSLADLLPRWMPSDSDKKNHEVTLSTKANAAQTLAHEMHPVALWLDIKGERGKASLNDYLNALNKHPIRRTATHKPVAVTRTP